MDVIENYLLMVLVVERLVSGHVYVVHWEQSIPYWGLTVQLDFFDGGYHPP